MKALETAWLLAALAAAGCTRGPEVAPLRDAAAPGIAEIPRVLDDGYRGIWYMNQAQPDEFRFKYSGGFATYPQQHIPLAVYSPEADRTFFVYGGRKKDRNQITNMVSYYDHSSGTVPRPVELLTRGTNDAHYNPTMVIDRAGHIYVFANSHGDGYELDPSDPTYGESYIFRSTRPHSIDGFQRVKTDLFSYSQAWATEEGLLWLHTRYQDNERALFWATSEDGIEWSDPRQLAYVGRGDYQISWSQGRRVATAFDYHPEQGGLNARTNIYYLETSDLGKTWTTIGGQPVTTPLREVENPALVHDYESEGLLVYLKDLKFDAAGHPVILYLTSRGYKPGPESGPRIWRTARWTGGSWEIRKVAESDHNYDHGSLYIESDGTWRVIAPLGPGPQPHGTGGEVQVLVSLDRGGTWSREDRLRLNTGRNQTYMRGPVGAHPGFYAFWADGDALNESESRLYFANRQGEVYRLPAEMAGDRGRPERVVE